MSAIKTQYTLRLNNLTYSKIQKIADENNLPLANMVVCIIKQYINTYENEYGEIEIDKQ